MRIYALIENERSELLLSHNKKMGKWRIPFVIVQTGMDPHEAVAEMAKTELDLVIEVKEHQSDARICRCVVACEQRDTAVVTWSPEALSEHLFWSLEALKDRKIPFRLPDGAPVSLAYIALNMTPEEETILQRFVLREPLVYQI